MELSDFFTSINSSKKNLILQDSGYEKVYIPYVINKSMSYFIDSLFYANQMNQYPQSPKRMQYEYYLHKLSKKPRFSKWHKDTNNLDNIKIIQQFYGYSVKKAKEVVKILTQEQINKLQEQLKTGGNIK